MVAPPWYEVPPTGYGGTEAILARLVDGLVDSGHDVTVVAAGRDLTAGRFLQTYAEPPRPDFDSHAEVAQAAMAARLLDEALRDGRLDLVHDHSVAGPLLARGRDVPTVVTTHLPPEDDLLTYYRALDDTVAFVAISESQRRQAPELPWVATVHHGIEVEEFPYREDKEDQVCFLGRFSPEKGAHLAIDAAREAGIPIVLAGKCSEDRERRYFEAEIAPRLGPDARYIGVADFPTKCRLLARSRCLVFPILWEEPFGLVMTEAMACGTPVVALRRGSVPEVVVDEVTGLILDDPDDLPTALRDAKRLAPKAARRHVETSFSREAMVRGYQAAYRAVLSAA
ncbi:MAG TPA: glycosyltransferase family 4 protein [Actinopolymorphaceae bacterium]